MQTKSPHLVVLSILFAVSNISYGQLKQSEDEDRDNHASVVRIVAHPDTFDGEIVQAYGAFRVIEETNKNIGAILCTESDSAKRKILPNCLYIEVPKSAVYLKKMSGKYVLVDGVFYRSLNVLEMNVGRISQITSIEVIEPSK